MLKNKKFVAFTQVQGFMMGVMFAYIASSPFIFQNSYGLLPLAYSLCFGVNALSLMQGGSRYRQVQTKATSPKGIDMWYVLMTYLCFPVIVLLTIKEYNHE
ncbi:hypothetical protein [Dysgonomonas sp.]|uniref:hypothetical protein n=1 Tax=Dysgonomonas sp. TaxID=1891233 RepID=UPI0027B93B06|nr:hypothetical protein [Dysgonomonas sp.]